MTSERGLGRALKPLLAITRQPAGFWKSPQPPLPVAAVPPSKHRGFSPFSRFAAISIRC
ncbi:conserved hypothetical protein [Thiomonas arsenitoxydans]|uniref:Uncharacterized protein n=1 Tax=Thiomonas arsenitoxydans (strain DSM 22701 / CIP 110005 / 3As) TaxID=426114 RepID=D6CNE1_THIA3|nr:hypothetical protein THI_3482 [Thiomonas arsenitoxydans]CQR37101.1 conserved hypothetical protein [Thiomonas arsenitoxydans]CQR38218.1 conserved hypothetical protein [Thiomonas arsenitoxydans]CQR40390.1 conserved hypothetical protein [Thiomonas arsenitoxydans]CQR40456.1 conserved hypothetical protein [Thiomonas arsenitoxydans]